MKITITTEIEKKYSQEEILEICLVSTGSSGDILLDTGRTFGNYITIEDSRIKKYVLLSSKTNDSRNAYIAQFFSTAYSDFVLDNTAKNKSFEVYLFPNKSISAPYNKFIYRLFKTCNIKILNEIEILKTVNKKFDTFKEIEMSRKVSGSKNKGNNPTYFSEEDDRVDVFGKVFGANGKETSLICFALNKILKKPIWLYQVYENEATELSGKDVKALESLGVIIKEKISEIDNTSIRFDTTEKDLRDTPKFHYNILKKFDSKKCYLCSCDIGGMIIGAHIHRVTDIKKDETISTDKKIAQIVDGDNGLWLCADHDKLFELGLIYFDKNRLTMSHLLNDDQKKFISEITEKFEIDPEHFNNNMESYINKHRERVLAH